MNLYENFSTVQIGMCLAHFL